MWKQVQKFSLGATLAGMVLSILAVFLFHDTAPYLRDAPALALVQSFAAAIVFGCVTAVLYGVGVKILRASSQGSLAIWLGAACALAQYGVSAGARFVAHAEGPVLERILLVYWIGGPLAAAVISRVLLSRSPGPPA